MLLRTYETTDELRRLAIQLAIQLPESVEDSRRVLAMTTECLDKFLIVPDRQTAAVDRACRLWRLSAPVEAGPAAPVRPSQPRAIAWSLSMLLVATPVGALLDYGIGAGSGLSFGFAVVVAAIVFGVAAGMLLALISPIIHNFVLVPPALTFNWPSGRELVCVGFYVLFAIAVPPLMSRLCDLRRLAAGRPRLTA